MKQAAIRINNMYYGDFSSVKSEANLRSISNAFAPYQKALERFVDSDSPSNNQFDEIFSIQASYRESLLQIHKKEPQTLANESGVLHHPRAIIDPKILEKWTYDFIIPMGKLHGAFLEKLLSGQHHSYEHLDPLKKNSREFGSLFRKLKKQLELLHMPSQFQHTKDKTRER